MNSRTSSPADATPLPHVAWEVQRRRLSHDALKNLAVLTLRRLERVATGRVIDPSFGGPQLAFRLKQVENILSEAETVIDSCATANSPSTALKDSPLSDLEPDVYDWLSTFLDRRWCDQQKLREKIGEAKRLLRRSRSRLGRLESRGIPLAAVRADEGLASDARGLAQDLSRLADILSALPRGPVPC